MRAQTRESLEFEVVLAFYGQKAQTQEGLRCLMAMDLMPFHQQQTHYGQLDHWYKLLEYENPLRFPELPSPRSLKRDPRRKPFEAELLRSWRDLLSFWCRLFGDDRLAFTMARYRLEVETQSLANKLVSLFNPDGSWSDAVSPRFAQLLQQMSQTEKSLEQTLKNALQRYSSYLSESIIYQRNGRRQ